MTKTPTPVFELALTGIDQPHQYVAFVPDGDGGRAAEHSFEWRSDSVALALDLRTLEQAALAGQPPDHDKHIAFGRRLFDAAFAGPLKGLWQTRLAAARRQRQPLRLLLRPDPNTARLLLNLPWEYLHDGHDFLALNWRTPIARLPWGLPADALPPLEEPLRLLVVIAAPLGLNQDMVLNTAREEDLILAATSGARRTGKLVVEFTPGGSLEALERALDEFDPHALHFTGHGLFLPGQDTGVLLMETPEGHQLAVPNARFAGLIERRARSLRFVFLSACQSALAPAHNRGYADLAPRLLEFGVAGVVAMQFSVLNRSAMDFGATFYKGVADGKPLDVALLEARGKLAQAGLNSVDFATPVLFASDVDCLRVQLTTQTEPGTVPVDLTGMAAAQHFAGRSAELRELQAALDPEHGRCRAAIIHGLGGMGKTVLASRLAERMASRLDGVKAIRVTPTTTARDVLDQLSAYLLVNQVRFNTPAIDELMRIKDEPLPLEAKAAKLAEILRARKLLLIFDNFEDVLPHGQPVSRAAQDGATAFDPDLPKLIRLLIEGVPGPSRFVFTSRVDFSPLEPGRLSDAVLPLPLGEMQFRDAVYLMEHLPPLDELPVAPPPTPILAPAEVPAQAQPITMRDVYARVGGHPFTLNLFAEHARRTSVGALLADLSGVTRALVDATLFERAVEQLTARARQLLLHAAVYDQPVPPEGLAFLLGDEHDCMPDVAAEVQALLGWGLLTHERGEEAYALPALVRDWLLAQLTPSTLDHLNRRAAQFWLGVERDTNSLFARLYAHEYLFAAGEYEQAYDIIELPCEFFQRWGYIEISLHLLSKCVPKLTGLRLAHALHNLGIDYQELGRYEQARQHYEQSLIIKQKYGDEDRHGIGATLNQLGLLHFLQDDYGLARQRYEQALKVKQVLGDRHSAAFTQHNMANLYSETGDLDLAKHYYEMALAAFQEYNDVINAAGVLQNMGSLCYQKGDIEGARKLYEQSNTIFQGLGDKAHIAASHIQLGTLYRMDYDRAYDQYQQALTLSREIGNRSIYAFSLYNLGTLIQTQGDYEQARQLLEQALAIEQELGEKHGIADSLYQLGHLHYMQKDFALARGKFEQALVAFRDLDDKANAAKCTYFLGNISHLQGDSRSAQLYHEQALAAAKACGDKVDTARSLYQLGTLHHVQGQLDLACNYYKQAADLFGELNDQVRAAESLYQLGNASVLQGNTQDALEYYEQALAIKMKLPDGASIAERSFQLGTLYHQNGKYVRAHQLYEQTLSLYRDLGDKSGNAKVMLHLGMLHEDLGEYQLAHSSVEQALAAFQELEEKDNVAMCMHELGNLHLIQGKHACARDLYEQSLSIERELGNKAGIAKTLGQLGVLHEKEGRFAEAVRTQAESFALFIELNAPEREMAQQQLFRLREKVGVDVFEAVLRDAGMEVPSDLDKVYLTLEQAEQYVIINTVDVLTQMQDKKGRWCEELKQMGEQIRASGSVSFATFLALVQQLVEGAQAETLSEQIPAEYRNSWDAIIHGESG